MKRESRKRAGLFWLAAGIAIVIVGVLMIHAAGEDGGPADYSGIYTDKQGTDEVYSELELSRNADGTYAVTLGIHRVTTLAGTAAEKNGALHFASSASTGPAVEGDIVVSGKAAEITITGSDFPEIRPGEVYRFPDGEPQP